MIEFKVYITLSDRLVELPVILDLCNTYNYVRTDLLTLLGYYPPKYRWKNEHPECEDLMYFLLPSDGELVHEDIMDDEFIIVSKMSVPLKFGQRSKVLQHFDIDFHQNMLVPHNRERFHSCGIQTREIELRKCKARKIKQKPKSSKAVTLIDFICKINEITIKRFSLKQWSFMAQMYMNYYSHYPAWKAIVFCKHDGICDCSSRVCEWEQSF